jgi:hypothetical protein
MQTVLMIKVGSRQDRIRDWRSPAFAGTGGLDVRKGLLEVVNFDEALEWVGFEGIDRTKHPK